jgi:hypothetical protein
MVGRLWEELDFATIFKYEWNGKRGKHEQNTKAIGVVRKHLITRVFPCFPCLMLLVLHLHADNVSASLFF